MLQPYVVRGAFSDGVEVQLKPPEKGAFDPLQMYIQRNQINFENAHSGIDVPPWLSACINHQGVSDAMLQGQVIFDPKTNTPVYHNTKDILNTDMFWISDPHRCKVPPTEHQMFRASALNREKLMKDAVVLDKDIVIATKQDTLGAVLRSTCARNFRVAKERAAKGGKRPAKTKRKSFRPLPQFTVDKINRLTHDDESRISKVIAQYYKEQMGRELPEWLFGDLELNPCKELVHGPMHKYVWYPMVVTEPHYATHLIYITVVMRIHTFEMMLQKDEIKHHCIVNYIRILQDSYHFITFFMTDSGRFSDSSLMETTYEILEHYSTEEDKEKVQEAVAAVKSMWDMLNGLNREDASSAKDPEPPPLRKAQRYYDIVKPSICNVMHEGELPNLIQIIRYILCIGDKKSNIPFQLTKDQDALYDVIKKFEPKQMNLRSTDDMTLIRADDSYLVYKVIYLLLFASFCGYYRHSSEVTKFCIRNTMYRHLAYNTQTRDEFVRFLSGHYSLCYNREDVKATRHPKLVLYIVKEFAAAMIVMDPALHHAVKAYMHQFDSLMKNWMTMMNTFRRFLGDVIYGTGSNFLRSASLIDMFYTRILQSTAEKLVSTTDIKDVFGKIINPLSRRKQRACKKPPIDIKNYQRRINRAALKKEIPKDVLDRLETLDSEGFVRVEYSAGVICNVDDAMRSEKPEETPTIPFIPAGIMRGAIRCMLEHYLANPNSPSCSLERNDNLKKCNGWIICTTPKEQLTPRKTQNKNNRTNTRTQLITEDWILSNNPSTRLLGQKSTVRSILEDVKMCKKTPHAAEISLQLTKRYMNAVAAGAWLYMERKECEGDNSLIMNTREYTIKRIQLAARRVFRDALPDTLWPVGEDRVEVVDKLIARYCGPNFLEPTESDYRHVTYIAHGVSMIYNDQRCDCPHCSLDQFGSQNDDWNLYMEFQEYQHRGHFAELLFSPFVLDPVNVMLEKSYGADHNKMYRMPTMGLVDQIRQWCVAAKSRFRDNPYLKSCMSKLTESELLFISNIVRSVDPSSKIDPMWMCYWPLCINRKAMDKFMAAVANYENNTYTSHLKVAIMEMCVGYPRTMLLLEHFYTEWALRLYPCIFNLPLRILRQQIYTLHAKYNLVGDGETLPSKCTSTPICTIHGEIKTQRAAGDMSVVGGKGYVGIHVDMNSNAVYCMKPMNRAKARNSQNRQVDPVVNALVRIEVERDDDDANDKSHSKKSKKIRSASQFSDDVLRMMKRNLEEARMENEDNDNDDKSDDDTEEDDDLSIQDHLSACSVSGASDSREEGEGASNAPEKSELEMTHVIQPRAGQRHGRGTAANSKSAKQRRAKLMEETERKKYITCYGEQMYQEVLDNRYIHNKGGTRNNMEVKQLRDDLCTEPLMYVNMLGRLVQLGPNKLAMNCPYCETQMYLSARCYGPLGLSCGECTKEMIAKMPHRYSDFVRCVCRMCPATKCAHKIEDVVARLVYTEISPGRWFWYKRYFCKDHNRKFIGNIPWTTIEENLNVWLAHDVSFVVVGGDLIATSKS